MSNLSKPNTNRIKTVLLIYKRKSSQIAEADRHILVLASHDKCCRRQLSLENTKHYQRATFLQMKYNRRTSLLVTFWRKKWRPMFHKKKFNFVAHIVEDSRHFKLYFLSAFYDRMMNCHWWQWWRWWWSTLHCLNDPDIDLDIAFLGWCQWTRCRVISVC